MADGGRRTADGEDETKTFRSARDSFLLTVRRPPSAIHYLSTFSNSSVGWSPGRK